MQGYAYASAAVGSASSTCSSLMSSLLNGDSETDILSCDMPSSLPVGTRSVRSAIHRYLRETACDRREDPTRPNPPATQHDAKFISDVIAELEVSRPDTPAIKPLTDSFMYRRANGCSNLLAIMHFNASDQVLDRCESEAKYKREAPRAHRAAPESHQTTGNSLANIFVPHSTSPRARVPLPLSLASATQDVSISRVVSMMGDTTTTPRMLSSILGDTLGPKCLSSRPPTRLKSLDRKHELTDLTGDAIAACMRDSSAGCKKSIVSCVSRHAVDTPESIPRRNNLLPSLSGIALSSPRSTRCGASDGGMERQSSGSTLSSSRLGKQLKRDAEDRHHEREATSASSEAPTLPESPTEGDVVEERLTLRQVLQMKIALQRRREGLKGEIIREAMRRREQ